MNQIQRDHELHFHFFKDQVVTNILDAMKDKHLSIKELSKLAGISKSHMFHFLSSRHNVTLEIVFKIAHALELTPSYLLRDASWSFDWDKKAISRSTIQKSLNHFSILSYFENPNLSIQYQELATKAFIKRMQNNFESSHFLCLQGEMTIQSDFGFSIMNPGMKFSSYGKTEFIIKNVGASKVKFVQVKIPDK